MKSQIALWAILLTVMVMAPMQASAGEPGELDARKPHFLGRLRPVGGCNPDGRGLFHWWNPHCFPRPCGPDDYCRKPMPNVCRSWPLTHAGAYPQPQPTPPAPTYPR
jgi:hypothetical protein